MNNIDEERNRTKCFVARPPIYSLERPRQMIYMNIAASEFFVQCSPQMNIPRKCNSKSIINMFKDESELIL